ncbi:hypothetical protein FN976_23040 [Caenimonas sedimenti]|uniref:Uncharacterized protein n=1 Tax=Caenimonas sedimenti TaxID=2596921 RepID=A0A562ZIV4_9BURK|nr:hypothetical protein [Caenimonas sedimenti]TWO68510.1 hypothetical protein FN976_23040 [Caenimonas sedimenti]
MAHKMHRLLLAAVCLVPHLCLGQEGTRSVPPECARFLGLWSGTLSLGFYGKQRIHVTQVSDQCVATLAYSPTEAMPESSSQIPIQAGVMTFACSVPGSTCRLEVKEDALHLTVTTPSGFVNTGVFRKAPPGQ